MQTAAAAAAAIAWAPGPSPSTSSSSSPSSFRVRIASPGGTAAPAPRLVAASGRPRRRQGSSSIPVSCLVVVQAIANPDPAVELPLTAENVEAVLDEVRPYLMADGGNVALHEIDGNVVRLKLQGACGSCPASVTTMKMGIERRLMEKIPEIVAVEPIADEETGLELNQENIEKAESTDQDKGSSLQRMPEAEEQTVTNPSGEVVASEDPVVPEEPLAEHFPLLPHLLQLVVLRVHALPS
ncbi:hypothetical protein PR202_gb16824 [Eleusine coracana subsp. coracana]|uniref:NIF system FeS cluster assembly NifU C-terminal domain-containing protein n=1 Tax=Eleusine coracana subsp. coracana TaxID=191504 RepID=A0AAV5F1B2_ELECO|nr:hypothetical protein PR202_gb16824 [Eleusine coracana subsp. coracana]